MHGLEDRDVPWEISHRLMMALDTEDATLTLIKQGDHRLSTPGNLALLARLLSELSDASAEG